MGDKKEDMKDWDQTQLITWIKSISTSKLSETVKEQIINGINKYSQENDMKITGKDFSEAEKDEIKEICKIDGLKAKKLLAIIEDQLDSEFEDQSNKFGNEGSRLNNDTSNDSFTLNIYGSQGLPIKLRNIRKTMLVKEVKSLYLIECGNDTAAHKYAKDKWGTDQKGQISFKYSSHTMLDNKTLSSYDCNDGLLPVFCVFRVQGGAEQKNMDDNSDELPYKKGDKFQLKIKVDESYSWVHATVKTVSYNRMEVTYDKCGDQKDELIFYGTELQERVKPLTTDNDNSKSNTTDLGFTKGQSIQLSAKNTNTGTMDWVPAQIAAVSEGYIRVQYKFPDDQKSKTEMICPFEYEARIKTAPEGNDEKEIKFKEGQKIKLELNNDGKSKWVDAEIFAVASNNDSVWVKYDNGETIQIDKNHWQEKIKSITSFQETHAQETHAQETHAQETHAQETHAQDKVDPQTSKTVSNMKPTTVGNDDTSIPFKEGQKIKLRLHNNSTSPWVDAEIFNVASTNDFVWVKHWDGQLKIGQKHWQEKIQSIKAFSETNDAEVKQEDKDEAQTSKTISNMKKMGFKVDDKVEVLTYDTKKWVNGTIVSVYKNVITIQHEENETNYDWVDESELKKRVKLRKDYTNKPMSEWNKNDVRCWVESIPAFKKYAKKISKSIDGKELLDTTSDDLTLIVSSSLHRRKFMEKLEVAKEKYTAAATDDQKSTDIEVNGLVCLNNLGNTCYMNTSIQLLSHTPYLTRYLKKRAKSHDFITAKNNEKFAGKFKTLKKCVTSQSFDPYHKQNVINHRHMLNAWTNLCDIIYNQPPKYWKYIHTPSNIRNALYEIDEDFGSGEQDDSVRSLTIMLQALDSEIEDEINQNRADKNGKGKFECKYMDKHQLKHGNLLSKSDENKVIQKLLSKHNPNNSIVRKTFDGVERLIYECLHCNKILQQYVICRDLDLPVISHDVIFNNIYIIFNDKFFALSKCTLLDFCSIDVLKYEVMQQSDAQKEEKIDIRDIDVITLSNSGKLKYFDRDNKISELQQSNDNIFVLINKHNNQMNQSQAKLLQFKIFIDEKGEPSTSSKYKYIKCNQNNVCHLINEEIGKTAQECDDNYIVHYNGNTLSPKQQMKKQDFQSIHNQQSNINVLFLLCIDSKNKEFDLHIKNIDTTILRAAIDKYKDWSYLEAVQKFGRNKHSNNIHNSSSNCYGMPQLQHQLQKDIDLELDRIEKTINELKKQECINVFVGDWMNTNFKSKASKTKELTDINECLEAYQKTTIVDNTVFEYKCVHCNEQCRYTKISKKIVCTPPVLILHLDRLGKESTSMRKTSKRQNKNRSRSHSNGRYSNGDYSSYTFASNKFDHEIQYKHKLLLNDDNNDNNNNKEYCLFGISNHTGTTKGGHYTATIKCLTDQKWYSISDSTSNETHNILHNEKSATILMYSVNVTQK